MSGGNVLGSRVFAHERVVIKSCCDVTRTTVWCSRRYLIIENFIPPEEKNKIMNRLMFDPEEDQWRFQPLVPAERSGSALDLLS